MKVLFLCTGNSARSQMAETLLQLIATHRFEAFSAGTHPVGVHPLTLLVLQEIGVDISHKRSKSITEFSGQQFDYVITVCDRAKESCPLFNGSVRMLHWSFEDPAAVADPARLDTFRRVRDEIADRICSFLTEEQSMPAGSLNCYSCRPNPAEQGEA
ncbi:MAG: arsenate reductase ArsC [Nitrospiraceae bacterium]